MKILIWTSVVCLLLVGCSKGSSSDSSSGGGGSDVAGMKAFQTNFYAYGKSQGCVNCHASTIAPFFVNPDVNVAYAAAKPLVVFTSPTTSVFAGHSGDNHCFSPSICGSATPAADVALAAWAAGELSTGTGGSSLPTYLTGTVNIPATLPTLMQTPTVVRFPLSALNLPIASLSGAVLEIEIQAADASEYRINNMKLVGGTASVTLQGIHVLVNSQSGAGPGTEDTAQGSVWVGLSATAPIEAAPSPLPAGPMGAPVTSILTTAEQMAVQTSGADKITIGFDSIH